LRKHLAAEYKNLAGKPNHPATLDAPAIALLPGKTDRRNIKTVPKS
jgi:hypothetical protein